MGAAEPRDLNRDHFFARYGSIAVLVGRMLPIIRTFIAFPAGVAKMNQARFHIYTFVGSWPWCYVLAYVGMRLGRVGTAIRSSRRSFTASTWEWRGC